MRDGDPRADDRARAGRELDALARGEIEPGVAGVGLRRERRVGPEPLRLRPRVALAASSGTMDAPLRRPRRDMRANRRTSRWGSRARTITPSSVSVRSSIGAPSAYRSESTRPSSYGTSSRTSSNRSAKRSAIRCLQLVDALACRGRDVDGLREAVRDAAPRPCGSSRSILLTTSSTGISPAPISASTVSTDCDLLERARPRAATRRRRGGRGPRRASPRASTRSPRRAASAAGG